MSQRFNPGFARVPQFLFVRRTLLALIPLSLLGYLAVGAVAPFPFANPQMPVELTQEEIASPSYSWVPVFSGAQYYLNGVAFFFNPPSGCWDQSAQSQFQRARCDFYWDGVQTYFLVGIMPLYFWILFWLAGFRWAKSQYLSARQALFSSQAVAEGKVKRVFSAPPQDFFGFLLGLSRVEFIPIENKKEESSSESPHAFKSLVAYVAPDLPPPLPNETYRLYRWKEAGRQKRYLAAIHAPHLAVVQGVRG